MDYLLIFIKKKNEDIWLPNYNKNIQYIEYSDYLIGVLLCLINLESLYDFFLDKNQLINIIEEDSIYTKYFYKITQDLWNYDDKENDNNLYINFMKEIKKSNIKDIFNDIKSLIEFLLLRLHDEQKTDNNEQKIKNSEPELYVSYNTEEELFNNFYSKNNSFIQQLFFFDLQSNYYCENCQIGGLQYYVNCILEFNFEQMNNKLKERIDIYDILDCIFEEDNFCECGQPIKIFRNLNNCPQYLIIVIKKNEINDTKFSIHENINIKKYISNNYFDKKIHYELVSFIQNCLITFCKSPVDKQWYKYEGKNELKFVK